MRRMVLTLLAAMVVALPALGGTATPAAAGSKVDAWVTVSSTRPAPGCMIDLAIELRKNGYPAAGSDVVASLAMNGELISADYGATDADGIVVMSLDATAGIGDRVDIMVGGQFLTGFWGAIGSGKSCTDGGTILEARANVPVGTALDDADVEIPPYVIYQQQRGLSCEYASLHIVTAAWGKPVSEYAFDEVVGLSPNPHWGYRGDILGTWGNTTDYGVYAAPLAKALPKFGFVGDAFYAAGDRSTLTSRIDNNVPVVVWLSLLGEEKFYEWTDDGTRYALVAGMHVVVVYDYNDQGVFISDPGTGGLRFRAWEPFIAEWNVLDGMALGVYPAS